MPMVVVVPTACLKVLIAWKRGVLSLSLPGVFVYAATAATNSLLRCCWVCQAHIMCVVCISDCACVPILRAECKSGVARVPLYRGKDGIWCCNPFAMLQLSCLPHDTLVLHTRLLVWILCFNRALIMLKSSDFYICLVANWLLSCTGCVFRF